MVYLPPAENGLSWSKCPAVFANRHSFIKRELWNVQCFSKNLSPWDPVVHMCGRGFEKY